jgi:hypothetical protein
MKIQALLSAACVLLTAVPSALAEEQSHAVAKPIEAFEDVLVSAGLYDPEDEDSEDMGDFVAKKDNNKKSNKKKSKKSNRKKSKKSNEKKSKKSNRRRRRRRKSRRNRRRRRSRSSRSYRNGMCRNPHRSDRELCDELEKDFCDSRRDFRQNERLCKNLGFRRSVTDEEWALMAETVSEFLPEDYAMLIDEVANNLDEYDEDSEDEDFSPETYESFDSEDEDSEDSADLYDSEDSEDEDSEDMGDFVARKDDSKKGNKKSNKKSNKNKKSKKSNKRKRSSNCSDRGWKSCQDKRGCEWKSSHGRGRGFCRSSRKEEEDSSDYDFESASEDFYSEY